MYFVTTSTSYQKFFKLRAGASTSRFCMSVCRSKKCQKCQKLSKKCQNMSKKCQNMSYKIGRSVHLSICLSVGQKNVKKCQKSVKTCQKVSKHVKKLSKHVKKKVSKPVKTSQKRMTSKLHWRGCFLSLHISNSPAKEMVHAKHDVWPMFDKLNYF